MPSPLWEYSESARRYRNTETGRFLSSSQMTDLRDRFLDTQRQQMRDLAQQLAEKSLTLPEWERGMREHIKQVFSGARSGGNSATSMSSCGPSPKTWPPGR
jgi:hypothetical protein